MPQTAITVTPSTGDGSRTTFTLSSAVVSEDVYVGRLHQDVTADYSISGTTLTLAAAPVLGETVSVYGIPLGSISATSPTATSKTGFATAGTIINRTAVQLGLSATAASSMGDPYASTDQNFVQLCELLNATGEDLQSKHDWAHLIREGTIATVSSGTAYALPVDFYRMTDESQWNRSTRLPMIGPLSGQESQYLKARLSGVLVQVAYRTQANIMTFPISPPNSQTLAFEYVSGYWVWSAAGTQPDSGGAAATGDTVLYDRDLMIAALKLAYLENKGFDTGAARERYEDILQAAISKNVGSKILNMGGAGINADHLIDASNLPVTGYAS